MTPTTTVPQQANYLAHQQQQQQANGNIAAVNVKHQIQEQNHQTLNNNNQYQAHNQQHQQQQMHHQQQQQQAVRPGENLLTTNEIQLCSSLNLPPTQYITLKTVLLSGAPITSSSSIIENSIRKYLINAGWLTH